MIKYFNFSFKKLNKNVLHPNENNKILQKAFFQYVILFLLFQDFIYLLPITQTTTVGPGSSTLNEMQRVVANRQHKSKGGQFI
jgi:hypothetical protein